MEDRGRIPGSSVNAVGQDGDGYLWLATNNGLFRLDGVRFTQWNPPDGSSRQDRVGASRPSGSECAKEF
jgi:ligand-binding sensor domain-containing protein